MIWKLLHIFSMSAFSLEDSENGFWGFACFQLWFAVDNDWNCALISLTIPKELCSFNCLSVSLLLPVCWNSWHSWLLSLLMLPLMLLILRLSLAENFSEQSHLGWESLLSLTSAKFSWKQFPPITGEKELVLLFSNWLYSGSREWRAVYFSILKGSRSQIPCVATDNSVRFSHLNSGEWLLLFLFFFPWNWQEVLHPLCSMPPDFLWLSISPRVVELSFCITRGKGVLALGHGLVGIGWWLD